MSNESPLQMSPAQPVLAIIQVKITRMDKFMEYVAGHLPSVGQYGGKIIFESFELRPVMGDFAPPVLVIHEWPSFEAFDRWFASPEYAPWKAMRHTGADVTVTVARQRPLDEHGH